MARLMTPDGTEIAYDLMGSRPVLVLLHRLTQARRAGDPLVGPLAADHTVLAVDLPGHGESSEPPSYDLPVLAGAVASAVQALDLHDPLVIGHSLGGVVATLYGGMAPARGVINIDQSLALGDFKAALAQLEPALRGDEASFQAAIAVVFDALDGALPAAERDRVA